MNVLVWFKRDLRVQDHPALTLAAGLGAVLPLYIIEPDYWAQPDTSPRQWAFTAEALGELRRDLGASGAPLVLRMGEAVATLSQMCRLYRIDRIISHEETGNRWTYARDRAVAAWARQAGIDWIELPQSGVVRRLNGRDGWARQRDRFMAEAVLQTPALQAVSGVEPGMIAPPRGLRPGEDPCPHRQTGGRAQASLTLSSFLTSRGAPYRSHMSSPLTGERACSRLSPYLALGILSGREVSQATSARQAEKPQGGWGGSLSSFQSRLAWRDHFVQKLEDEPAIEWRALHRAADRLRPATPDATRLGAWRNGETGLPFLDACMRYLAATGWLNFRMRSMVMSFASYHLWLDWRPTGAHLARRFTDYEPGIHWPQVQMQSGVTGINQMRVYNPVKQGLEQDPKGLFTRRWVPELASVPDGFLQEPWKWPGAATVLGRRYPEPLVDISSAARLAKDAVADLRRASGFSTEAASIVARHASRADGTGRFVNDRAKAKRSQPPRARTPSSNQLSFDL